MAHDVGDRLEDDPERGDLDRGGQCQLDFAESARTRHRTPGRAGQPIDRLAARADQAELVERRRAQSLDDATHVDDGRADFVAELGS